jgi:hypothetical protein
VKKRYSFTAFLFLWIISCAVLAQQITIVSVTSKGFGRTEQEAVSDAIINGVAQVNGETIAASMRVKTSSIESTSGQESGVRSIEEDMERRTRGVVKAWKPISVNATGDGDLTATVQVSVAVLSRSDQLKRLKLAVVPSNRGDPRLSLGLAEEVVTNLTTSRKFAVMDRKNNDEIASQLSSIRNGDGAVEDQARLTGELAPDFLVVVTLEAVDRKSSKSTAVALLEVIDYSSRQIKFSEKKSFPLKTGDDFSNRRRIAILGKGLSRAVIQTVYPPVIVGSENGYITIGQGSDFFNKGDGLVIKKVGSTIRDPHTGEFLSNDHTDVGKAEIVYVDKRIARAKLLGDVKLIQILIADKGYQVWRNGESMDDFFGVVSSTVSVVSDGKKTKKLFLTDDDDD